VFFETNPEVIPENGGDFKMQNRAFWENLENFGRLLGKWADLEEK
jgi:hypothetical protein